MSHLNETIWQTNGNTDRLIIGIVYSLLSISIFPVSLPIVYTLYKTNEFKENVSYKLINILNICDLLQSFCHALSGIYIVFPLAAKKVDAVVRITGYTANTLWIAGHVIIAVLALTRLDIIFFHLKTDKWAVWMKITLFIGGSYILVIWIIGCVSLNYQLSGVMWEYDANAAFVDFLGPMELYVCFPILVLSFTSYMLILVNIYSTRQKTESVSTRRTEISILIQATVLTTYMSTLIALWHNAGSWFEMTDITLAFLNGAWIMFPHLNSFLLITTNRTVRRKIVSSLCGSSENPIVGNSSSGGWNNVPQRVPILVT